MLRRNLCGISMIFLCLLVAVAQDEKPIQRKDSAGISAALSPLRLQGLERVYFQHVGGPENLSAMPPSVGALLPEVILADNSEPKTTAKREGDDENKVQVRDFRLPLQRSARRLFLRQIVVDPETSRITKLWWALYDDGRRSDVWYFSANPMENENKALSNYEIESASASGSDSLELRVRGIMFRPQGAFWITGKAFSFSSQGDMLELSRVRNVFGFFRDYDTGDTPPSIEVATERETGGRFETRTYNSVPDGVLRHCQFRNPTDENWEFTWAQMESTALCVSREASVRTTYRGLDQPSFVERRGKPSDW
jgi:hypothetical protein